MAEFAQFTALKESENFFRLPDNGSNKKPFNFDLPNLNPAHPVIVMFKVAMSGDATLVMVINDNAQFSVNFTLDPPPGLHQPRSWHEILGPNEGLKASKNVLRVVNNTPSGSVVAVSDIVFLYSAKTI